MGCNARYAAVAAAAIGLAITYNQRCNMRSMVIALSVVGLALVAGSISHAGDKEAMLIIEKAAKAHGVGGKDAKADKSAGYVGKNKGVAHVQGMDFEFTQEISVLVPSKFREAAELNLMGQKLSVITMFDGKKAWITVNGMDLPVEQQMLDEFKESTHMMRLMQGAFLKDKGLKYSLLGQAKVGDKDAVGVKISKEGFKDVDIYFDKSTGLMAKIARRALDMQSGQEVNEDRIILDYQEIDGRKTAKKLEVRRDGQVYLELEVIEGRFVETLDDSLFTKPGNE
jgi:hypothetical protein